MNSLVPNDLCKQEMNSERSSEDLGGLFLLFFNQNHCAGTRRPAVHAARFN